uniref:BACK domain-containing protein n=1 Tax=Panagrolaimus sp. ES5 TaxID=591445 RepID=A0AC34FRB2_9BILA
MLCFLYTDDCPIDGGNVWEMLNMADTYGIPLLVEKCMKYICETVNKCNVLEYSQRSLIYDKNSMMMKKCWEIINNSYDYVITTEAFLKISPELLAEIAQHCIRDNENLFFDQVIAWSRKECERRGVNATVANIQRLLSNIKPKLHFEQMDVYNLVTKVRNSGLLSSKELLDAIAAVATEQRSRKLQKQQSEIDTLNHQLSLDMDFLERWQVTPNPAFKYP